MIAAAQSRAPGLDNMPSRCERTFLSSFTEKHFGLTSMCMVTLDGCSLFSRLQPHELKALQEAAQEKRFANGQEVFKEGDTGDGVYVVKEGQVQISSLVGNNVRHVFSEVKPGEFFGEM